MKSLATLLFMLIIITSCDSGETDFDASGSFEATEIIVPAEAQGVIRHFELEEGDKLGKGTVVGFIDSTQLYLKKRQLEAQVESLLKRRPEVRVQLATFETQLATANTEKARIEKLVEADAATTKQLDDINAQIQVLEKQIAAQRSTLSITTQGITMDANAMSYQIAQLEDQISKCKIIVPIDGIVLQKYAEPFEMAQPGKALFKIANMQDIILKAFFSGSQLPSLELGQKVTVQVDDGEEGYRDISGSIIWISANAEFTPKTIQTKEERVNKVYAVKISVPNDGKLKIGMYGQVIL